MTAGGSHHRQVRQNDGRQSDECWICAVAEISGVFVVRGIWVNELSFDRPLPVVSPSLRDFPAHCTQLRP